MLVGAYDRSGPGSWDVTQGVGPFEVDPTDESGVSIQQVSQPERRLLFAILSDAIVRVRRLASAPRAAANRELLEAERWMRSDDRSWPCSYVNVCEALDIAYEPLRRAMLRWRHADDRRKLTRRSLLFKKKTRKRDAGAVPAGASASVGAEAALTLASQR